jgi:hypothetical protein
MSRIGNVRLGAEITYTSKAAGENALGDKPGPAAIAHDPT